MATKGVNPFAKTAKPPAGKPAAKKPAGKGEKPMPPWMAKKK